VFVDINKRRFILGVFEHVDIDLECDTNAKDGLMQLMQKRRMELPTYPVLSHVEGALLRISDFVYEG